MDDRQIVDMYWERDEDAIKETDLKYRKYLHTIAYNILASEEDSEESINETYFRTWNSIPANRPQFLGAYIGKITRSLSIDVYRARHRQKREASEYAVSLDELAECVSEGNTTESEVDVILLSESINSFLKSLSKAQRVVFVGRYFYMDSVKEIAGYTGLSEANVKTTLHRTRKSLKAYLEKEGYSL